ncbi:MAG: putative DNA-binding domain-containing protein [Blastomonas sp.]
MRDGQTRFMAALNLGPSAFPEDLFSNTRDRALLGLRAHANTISHARLVALEDSFPRTLRRLGNEEFNRLSRGYIETGDAMQAGLREIGRAFADWLAAAGCDAATVELARIEWAWLESYHAPECDMLTLADLAGLDEGALLSLSISLHPATRLVELSVPLAAELDEIDVPSQPAAMLLCRPDAEVMLVPIDGPRAAICRNARENLTMGNLLEIAIEQQGEARALPDMLALIEAGSFGKP